MTGVADGLVHLLALVAMVGAPVVLVRVLFGRADLSRLYRAEGDGWPRGIQEDEPRSWRFSTPRTALDELPLGAAEDAYSVRAGPLTRVRIGRPERSTP